MSLCALTTRCLRRPVRANIPPSTSPSPLTSFFSITLRSFATSAHASPSSSAAELLSPAVMFLVRTEHLDPASIRGTGKDGRLLKFDVVQAIKAGTAKKLSSSSSSASASSAPPQPTLKRQEGPRFTAGGRRNRSAMFEPLPKPAPAPAAAAKVPTTAQPTKLQSIDKSAPPAAAQPKAAAKAQPVAVLRLQEGPRYTAGGRRNRSAMFQSP